MNGSLSRRQMLLIASAAGAAIVGCRSIAKPLAAPPASEGSFKSLKLVYRTDTGRLLSAAASSSIPNLHEATLVIEAPHPQGVPQQALATVLLKPKEAGGATAFTLNIVQEEAAAPPQPMQRYAEIPVWQVEALVKKLRDDNFFKRSRSLNDEVLLSVKIDTESFGKKYRAVPEIDALIVQVVQEGRAEISCIPFTAQGPRRLPTIR